MGTCSRLNTEGSPCWCYKPLPVMATCRSLLHDSTILHTQSYNQTSKIHIPCSSYDLPSVPVWGVLRQDMLEETTYRTHRQPTLMGKSKSQCLLLQDPLHRGLEIKGWALKTWEQDHMPQDKINETEQNNGDEIEKTKVQDKWWHKRQQKRLSLVEENKEKSNRTSQTG